MCSDQVLKTSSFSAYSVTTRCLDYPSSYQLHRLEECCRVNSIYFMKGGLNQTKTCQELSSSKKKKNGAEKIFSEPISRLKLPPADSGRRITEVQQKQNTALVWSSTTVR